MASGKHARLDSSEGIVDIGSASELPNRLPIALVGVVILAFIGWAAYVGRGQMVGGIDRWVLLTLLNGTAAALAVVSLRRQPLRQTIVYWGILVVYLIGGLFQLYVLSYNINARTDFISKQAPILAWISQTDISQAYGLITLSFVLFCILVSTISALPIRRHTPIFSQLSSLRTLRWALLLAFGVYCVATVFERIEGFGILSLQNKPLPFHLVAITLFVRQIVVPSVLLIGIWVFEGKSRRSQYLCLIGIVVVAISDALVTTSRGALLYYGLPVLFLWVLTRKLTKPRMAIVVVGLVAYLIATPALTSIRYSRVNSTSASISLVPHRSALTSAAGHTVIRVGGAYSVMYAMHNEAHFSVDGIYDAYRPSGLTSYFTHQVVGLQTNQNLNEAEAPTVMGLGVLIGGTEGMVAISVLTLLGLSLLGRLVIRRFWSWPVSLALFTAGAVRFYSEGVPIQLYKILIGIVLVEMVYRYLVRVSPTLGGSASSDIRGCSQALSVGAKASG